MSFKFIFEKLARDNVFDVFSKKGLTPLVLELDQENHIIALKNKILEEAKEVSEAPTPQNLIEEIGDLEEAIKSLISLTGLSREEIDRGKISKQQKFGSFLKGLYLKSVLVPEGHPDLSYYRAHPEKYPEVSEDF